MPATWSSHSPTLRYTVCLQSAEQRRQEQGQEELWLVTFKLSTARTCHTGVE